MNTSKLVSIGKDKTGFSIIEVLIALAIFSIGILAVASMQVSANKESRTSAEITQATGIASDQMENLMLLPFDHADLDPSQNPHQRSSGKYRVQWLVTPSDLNADGLNESKALDMTVSWNAIFQTDSNQRQLRMVFLKHNQ
jgi:prepilin-type N-terminal cleavage/methylation domain-containing protein